MSGLNLDFDEETMNDTIGDDDWDDIFSDAEAADEGAFAGEDTAEETASEDTSSEDTTAESKGADEDLPALTKSDIIAEMKEVHDVYPDTSKNREELARKLVELRDQAAAEAEDAPEENAPENGAEGAQEDYALDLDMEDSTDALMEDEDEEDGIPDERPAELNDALKVENLEEQMDLETAIERMQEAQSDIATHENAKIMLRWRQGLIVANTNIVQGEQTMKRLADECGTHENTLRYCRNLVEFFNYDRQKFSDWVDETSKNNGKGYVRWVQDVIKSLLRGDSDPEVLGPEKYRDQAMSRVESTVQSLEKLNEHLQGVEDEDAHREVEGVTMQALDEIRRFMQSEFYQDGTYDPKEVVPRSEQYLEFIRQFPSPLSGMTPTVPHHRVRAGTGQKGSDFETIPLTDKEHKKLHSMDEEKFWREHGFSRGELANAYKHLYLTGQQNGVIRVPTPNNGLNRAKYAPKSSR